MSKRAYDSYTEEQINILQKYVKKIIAVPINTIEDIGGGGVRCMMAELY